MKIVLLGFDFDCPNKGCEALSYSFVSMLLRLFPGQKLEIHNVTHKDSLGVIPECYPEIKFIHHRATYKSIQFFHDMWKWNADADVIFDITYGDSFSDIYSGKWLFKTNVYKQFAVWSKTPFIMLPQTYGPYYSGFLKKWSLSLIKTSDAVYSRDALSRDYIKRENGMDVKVVTDLAFALPYDLQRYDFVPTQKVRVGVNVSSLLWEGGFTKNNQFGLTADYPQYCRSLVKALLENGNYEVHLIAHVIEDVEGSPENDLRSCRALQAEFPSLIMAPKFKTPIEAKSYICHMDVFTGARMHATIGAFSSGVATIPFSYSRKFEGLYWNLNYPFTVDGKTNTTEDAVALTLNYVERRRELRAAAELSMMDIKEKLRAFEKELADRICAR